MGSLTNFGRSAVANHLTTNSAYTPAADLYAGLSISSPGLGATGASANEVPDTGAYARTALTFGAASARRITQNADVDFPQASATWASGSDITHWFIADDPDYGEGNVLAFGAFETPIAVEAGVEFTIPSGQIYVEFTSSTGLSNYAANGMLDRMFRNQTFTVSANFVGLTTGVPTDTSTGATITEVDDDNDYARVEVNEAGGASPAWSSVSNGVLSNADAVDFAPPDGPWGNIKNAVILDSGTHGAGNLLWYLDITNQDVDDETTAIGFGEDDLDLAVA